MKNGRTNKGARQVQYLNTPGRATALGCAVYETSTKSGQEPRRIHDALLISKAPEMAEALKECLVLLQSAQLDTSSSFQFAADLGKVKGHIKQLLNSIHNGGDKL